MADVTATASAANIQTDYMKLLVTQLQNQNPLEPLNNQDMATQLSQFSQLQQLENVNTSFGKVLDSVQRSYASSLIGKEVSYKTTADNGTVTIQKGKVDEVVMDSKGGILLQIGQQQVALTDVTAIRD
jgi:flagellar basal-body rod modification protein FlgD